MSNAIQIRDASDVTQMKKSRAIQQNYIQLAAKNSLPWGGISHSDFLNVARTNATYIIANSIIPTVGIQAQCPSCSNVVSYPVSSPTIEQPCADCPGNSIQRMVYQEEQAINNNSHRSANPS